MNLKQEQLSEAKLPGPQLQAGGATHCAARPLNAAPAGTMQRFSPGPPSSQPACLGTPPPTPTTHPAAARSRQ